MIDMSPFKDHRCSLILVNSLRVELMITDVTNQFIEGLDNNNVYNIVSLEHIVAVLPDFHPRYDVKINPVKSASAFKINKGYSEPVVKKHVKGA